MLHTRLCDVLQIEVPLLCAPMGPSLTSPELAAAVSNAGGLGVISFGLCPPPTLRAKIRRIRELTPKPFGVNFVVPLLSEEHFAVCLDERVPVLSFFFGDPAPWVGRAHDAGARVIDQVGSVAAAQRSAQSGVDVVIAQGSEAGGHLAGDIGTFVIVPRVAEAIPHVPVVAAGGIADARGFVAALALGADGVSMGTRFLASEEAAAHPAYKARVVSASEADTMRTMLFGGGWPGAPHRVLRTPFVEEWSAQELRGQEQRPDEPVIGMSAMAGTLVPVQRFSSLPPSADATGDVEAMSLMAGQGVGLVRDVKPAAAIVHEIVDGARRLVATRFA